MCAIVDANRWHEVFSPKRTAAGAAFRRWLLSKRGFAVLGGKLRREIADGTERKKQVQEFVQNGMVIPMPDADVDDETEQIKKGGGLRSDDPHILALAKVSGARLLYTNDRNLQDDFKNADFVADGKVYSTLETTKHTRRQRDLLKRQVCQRTT